MTSVNNIAEAYVKLVLAMGQYDPDYVDAYYGPPEWKKQSETKKPLDAIALEATQLRDQLAKISMPAAKPREFFRCDVVTDHRVLQIGAPIDVRRAGNMAGVVEQDIFIRLDDPDPLVVKMFFQPIGLH